MLKDQSISQKRSFRPARLILPIILVVILLLVVLAGYKLSRVLALGQDLAAQTRALDSPDGTMLVSTAPGALGPIVRKISSDLLAIKGELGPFVSIGPLLSWIPDYGPDLAQAPALVEFAGEIGSGADRLLDLQDAITKDVGAGREGGIALGTALSAAVVAHEREIAQARAELAKLEKDRTAIDAAALSPRGRSAMERADRVLSLSTTAVEGLVLLPDLLGARGPREYLVLVQNSDELRATGGFISSVVRVRMQDGDIKGIEFSDSYAVDNRLVVHPNPPAALHRYMQADAWLVRDANWSPDFPTAAADAAHIYALDRGIQVDGVIAANLKLVPDLLRATGSIAVEGYSETVDASNAFARLQAYWASPQGQGEAGDWWEHRKDFSGQLFVAILEKIRQGDVDQTALLTTIAQALTRRELLLYAQDDELETRIREAGWDGSVTDTGGDSLMLVDSNVGFNKVDPNITREANLDITLDGSGQARSTVTIQYDNLSPDTGAPCDHAPVYASAYAAMQQGCYWNYLRLVLPTGARLTSTNLGDESGHEDPLGPRSVAWGYLVVPRGRSREARFEYTAPAVVRSGNEYELTLERQPGSPPSAWHIRLTLPPTWTGYRADPAPIRANGGVLEYELTLSQDWRVVVRREEAGSTWVLGLALAGIALMGAGAVWVMRRS